MDSLLPALRILQWNARSIKSNKCRIEKLVYDLDVDICILSETWLKPSDQFSLQNFNIFRKDRLDKAGGGAAVFVHKKFQNSQQINFITNPAEIDICGVNIQFDTSIFSFVSVYNPPNFLCEVWSDILKDCQAMIILGGDFNSHHQCWGDSYSNIVQTLLIWPMTTI